MARRGEAVSRKRSIGVRAARVAADAEIARVGRLATVELYDAVRRLGVARTASLFDVPPSQVSAAYETMTGRCIDSGLAMHSERVFAAMTVLRWATAAGRSDGEFIEAMQALLDIPMADARRLWLEVRHGNGVQDDPG